MYKPQNSFEVTYVESITVNSTVFCWQKVKYPLQSKISVKLQIDLLYFSQLSRKLYKKRI